MAAPFSEGAFQRDLKRRIDVLNQPLADLKDDEILSEILEKHFSDLEESWPELHSYHLAGNIPGFEHDFLRMGAGGFGTVYKGYKGGKPYALKRYGPRSEDGPEANRGYTSYHFEFIRNFSTLLEFHSLGLPVIKPIEQDRMNLISIFEFKRGIPVDRLLKAENLPDFFVRLVEGRIRDFRHVMNLLNRNATYPRNFIFDLDDGLIYLIDPN
ncbi:MAG: hypothetical protein KDD25_00845 [Bdellovibrionales bacterium]|nr:hypothetical protein [Bdellovibrionales bacterium]